MIFLFVAAFITGLYMRHNKETEGGNFFSDVMSKVSGSLPKIKVEKSALRRRMIQPLKQDTALLADMAGIAGDDERLHVWWLDRADSFAAERLPPAVRSPTFQIR